MFTFTYCAVLDVNINIIIQRLICKKKGLNILPHWVFLEMTSPHSRNECLLTGWVSESDFWLPQWVRTCSWGRDCEGVSPPCPWAWGRACCCGLPWLLLVRDWGEESWAGVTRVIFVRPGVRRRGDSRTKHTSSFLDNLSYVGLGKHVRSGCNVQCSQINLTEVWEYTHLFWP